MDIKQRIDGLTEAEAKAALLRAIENEALFRLSFPPRLGCWDMFSPNLYQRIKLENELLDEALKEARDA